MYFILIGKPIDFLAFTYLILPIINSPNHSGNKKSLLLYILFLGTVYSLNKFTSYWSLLFIASVLWLFNFVIESKNKYYENSEKLNGEIERFLESQLEIKRAYRMYKGLINVLNEIKILTGIRVKFKNIVCFKLEAGNVKLVNSSIFLWNYTISIDTKYFNPDVPAYDNSNLKLSLNGQDCSNNFHIASKTGSNNYIFLFVTELPTNFITTHYYTKLLSSITSRIARVIDIENSLIKENKKLLEVFKDKFFYIQNAEKAMHFIRNKFNNLDNFIEMSKDVIAGTMDGNGLILYSDELDRVKVNYKLLLERATIILSKSEKPFSATQLTDKSPMFLFNTVRDIWTEYYPLDRLVNEWDLKLVDSFSVKCNSDGLYILLSDWISNMRKYSCGDEGISFSEFEDVYQITLSNRYRNVEKLRLVEVMNDYNSVERDKILHRTSHGIIIMRTIVDEMGASSNIDLVGQDVKFVVNFKREKK